MSAHILSVDHVPVWFTFTGFRAVFLTGCGVYLGLTLGILRGTVWTLLLKLQSPDLTGRWPRDLICL